jgi:hypothetical protein
VEPGRRVASPATLHDPYAPTDTPPDELTLVTQAIERAERFHTSWVDKIEKRYRAYRGVAEKRNEETQSWRSNLTTPYLLQLVEGMIATMVDPKPAWDVDPRPDPGEPLEEILARQQSAKVATAALQAAMDDDDFFLKQRPFMQQDLIAGMTVAKVVWRYECRELDRLVAVDLEVTDDFGVVHDKYSSAEEQKRMTVIRDGPSMIVRDVRDFFWPESATSVDDAAWLIDRTWSTYDELKQKQDAGLYSNVEKLKNSQGGAQSTQYTEREQMLWAKNRTEGLIEVLEYWTDERMIAVGNRQVVLCAVDNPLKIKRKPFVVCSAMPDAFQMTGISVIEALAQLQEYLWTLGNQRIDALRLATNIITLIRSDVDDLDSFEFYPGAQWIVEDPGQVGQLQIDASAAQITLEAESLIKGDLQNMLGGLPFAGGAQSVMQGAGGSTATGMSIITSVAQKMIQARKQQYAYAWARIGELFLGMMGQMLREERTISQVGPGGQQLLVVHPLQLQGQFNVNVDVMDESTIRQERQTESMALMNLAGQLSQLMPLDLKPFMERVLDSYGITNTAPFFKPPGQGPPPGPPGGTPQGAASMQQPPPGPLGSGGQTNPGLAASMGQGGGGGLSMTPDQFTSQQLQAVQQQGMGAQG